MIYEDGRKISVITIAVDLNDPFRPSFRPVDIGGCPYQHDGNGQERETVDQEILPFIHPCKSKKNTIHSIRISLPLLFVTEWISGSPR